MRRRAAIQRFTREKTALNEAAGHDDDDDSQLTDSAVLMHAATRASIAALLHASAAASAAQSSPAAAAAVLAFFCASFTSFCASVSACISASRDPRAPGSYCRYERERL